MLKRQYNSVKTLSGFQVPKIKCTFYFHPTTVTCLFHFGVFKIKSLCYANLTTDVTLNFALFVFIFQVGSHSFQYYLVVRRIYILIKNKIFNILGYRIGISDFKKGFDKTLKNIPAVSKDLLRIAWMCMKVGLII